MQLEHIGDTVYNKLEKLPKLPGCYIFKDSTDKILYIGKASSLKNRVRSYFQKSQTHSNRIRRMIEKIIDLEWIVVGSEIEALILECNLIKEHQPIYNIRLKDDKSYPYIAISKETFPRVYITRKVNPKYAKYYGPYTSAHTARELVNILHKTFPLIPCGKSWTGEHKQRPCIYYNMNQCLAPCAGLSSAENYNRVVDNVGRLLSGKDNSILDNLKKEMEEASVNLNFEQAATIRDKINSIESLLSKQRILSQTDDDKDVVAIVQENNSAAIQLLYIRGGRMVGTRRFFIEETESCSLPHSMESFLKEYYNGIEDIPREILLQEDIPERVILEQWLKSKRTKSVSISIPQKGEKKQLINMALENAGQALNMMRLESDREADWAEQASSEIQTALQLDTKPFRLECYDISNIQGTNPVASMVVAEAGKIAKHEYRRFKIKNCPETPNDFAMMYEVITRRLEAYIENDSKFSTMPDVIVIDGGKGQLSSALRARDRLGLTIPVMVGLAKKQEIIVTATPISGSQMEDEDGCSIQDYSFSELRLDMNSPGLTLLRRLRDEAHRFAINYHRKLRSRRTIQSELDDIPGLGPAKKRALLDAFESVERIKEVSVEELEKVKGIHNSLAEIIFNYFHSKQ